MPIAIPALGAFAVAALALTMLLAVVLIGEILKSVFNITIPIVGNIGTILRGLVHDAVSRIASLLTSSVSGIGAVFHALWFLHSDATTKAQTHAQHVINRVGGVVHHTIPAAKATAIKWAGILTYDESVRAQTQLGTVAHNLQENINTAARDAHAELATTAHQLQVNLNAVAEADAADLGTVAHNLQANINALQRWATAAVADAEALTRGDFAELRGALVTDVQQVESYVQRVEQSVVTYAADVAAAAERNARAAVDEQAHAVAVALWPAVSGPAERAQQGVAAEGAGVLSGVPAIDSVAPASLAAVLAQTIAMAATATAYVDECGLGLCTGLRTLTTFLNGFEAAGIVAILLALAAQAASDPDGAAREVEDAITAPVEGFATMAAGLIGIRLPAS